MSTLLQNLDNEVSQNQLKTVKQSIYVHNFFTVFNFVRHNLKVSYNHHICDW